MSETHSSSAAQAGAQTAAPAVDLFKPLQRLADLTVKLTEIGPPLAEIASHLGYGDIAQRVLRLADAQGMESRFVAASIARRERRFLDVLEIVAQAARSFTPPADKAGGPDPAEEFLHLVRLGFATALFELDELSAAKDFVAVLAAELPRLASHYETDPFYLTLLAQTVWFEDPERSEEIWEQALTLGEQESTWNARGTWYKEAAKDLDGATEAYRQGLKAVPWSALLLHNLAQIELERAADPNADPEQARRRLKEANRLIENALKKAPRPRLKRHIFATSNRLRRLRASLPEPVPVLPAKVGERVTGKVVSLAPYGAFVDIGDGVTGLLHKSEISHKPVNDPAKVLDVGDHLQVEIIQIKPRDKGRGLRISLSRKATLPAPERKPGASSSAQPAKDSPFGSLGGLLQGAAED